MCEKTLLDNPLKKWVYGKNNFRTFLWEDGDCSQNFPVKKWCIRRIFPDFFSWGDGVWKNAPDFFLGKWWVGKMIPDLFGKMVCVGQHNPIFSWRGDVWWWRSQTLLLKRLCVGRKTSQLFPKENLYQKKCPTFYAWEMDAPDILFCDAVWENASKHFSWSKRV